jgi:hypothetical protein
VTGCTTVDRVQAEIKALRRIGGEARRRHICVQIEGYSARQDARRHGIAGPALAWHESPAASLPARWAAPDESHNQLIYTQFSAAGAGRDAILSLRTGTNEGAGLPVPDRAAAVALRSAPALEWG